jgi:hypothetical protein
MSDTPAQDCFDEPCKHCGSTKGFWFSRSEPMGYFCEGCGMPDNKESNIPTQVKHMNNKLFELKPCEECKGTAEAYHLGHNFDCPDCLGTGYEEPAKRIMNLERELKAVTEQRDRLAEALNRIANNNVQDLPETDYAYELGRMEGIAKIALQPLTTNETAQATPTKRP